MKKQNNQRRQSLLLASIIAAIFLLGAFAPTFAQKKSAVTEQEVKAYFTDWWTHDCEKSDECSVTFDSGVRIAPAVRHTFQIPPATYLTYPVKVDMTTHKNGGNFHLQHLTRAVYYFYRNSFGDWEMGKEDERITQEKDEHQEGGMAKAPTANAAPADGKQPANTKRDDKAGQAAAKPAAPPVPDFSEMEDYYEVVRYEYPKPPSTEMYLYLKPKVELKQRPPFYIQFRDKDGILIGAQNEYGNGIGTTPLYSTQIGETGKAWVYIPTEKEMEKVVSAKVVRIKQ